MDGIDRYEAQSIARDEARAVADELRRDIEYGDITNLRRELESLRADLHALQRDVRALDSAVSYPS